MTTSKKKYNPGWKSNDHWVTCDVCGLEYRHHVMQKSWDNKVVCPTDFEKRHPQDLIKAIKDDPTAKGLVNPEVTDQFKDLDFCYNTSAEAGVLEVGCAQAGSTQTYVEIPTIPQGTF